MATDIPKLPNFEQIRSHILVSLNSYWKNNPIAVKNLPIFKVTKIDLINGPLRLTSVKLPIWALECGVDGCILIPDEAVTDHHSNDWRKVDWWLATFLLLEAWHERIWEYKNGPIHSYSFRLSGWDKRAWEYAWVNRIGLFLRKWASHVSGLNPDKFLGSLPTHKIHMTHDIDAVEKTWAIRLKQGAFNLFNAFRYLQKGKISKMSSKLIQTYRFLFSKEDWWNFEKLQKIEKEAKITAVYNFHVNKFTMSPKQWLLNPSYDINKLTIKSIFSQLIENGHKIGLHPSFDAWKNPKKISAELKE